MEEASGRVEHRRWWLARYRPCFTLSVHCIRVCVCASVSADARLLSFLVYAVVAARTQTTLNTKLGLGDSVNAREDARVRVRCGSESILPRRRGFLSRSERGSYRGTLDHPGYTSRSPEHVSLNFPPPPQPTPPLPLLVWLRPAPQRAHEQTPTPKAPDALTWPTPTPSRARQ